MGEGGSDPRGFGVAVQLRVSSSGGGGGGTRRRRRRRLEVCGGS